MAEAGGAAGAAGGARGKHVVVVGGGIHGCSAAYHLAKRGARVTLLEREDSVAPAASGQAGGFLARDWGDSATREFHETSFAMHAELAEELGLSTYRVIPTLSVRGGRRGAGHVEAPWLDGDVASATLMDPTPGATAQVTPRELTEALADGARRLGADIRTGMRVVGVATAPGSSGENEERVATGVRCVTEGAGEKEEEELVEADAVLVCMGVWSAVASEWFGLPRDAWPLTGINLSALTSEAAGEPDEVGACMRPCAPDARPLMGGVTGFANAYLSAGHNCWGILWAPVSGAAMAELVLDGASSVASLEAFRPDRFLPRNRRGGRGRKQGSTDVGEQW
eukprot:PRCOL_00002834-RA